MDDKPRTVTITPRPDCLKATSSCQCDFEREKSYTAPLYKQPQSPTGDSLAGVRRQTAPISRDIETIKRPLSHVLITFISVLNPKQVFDKVFPSTAAIKYVKKKLGALLSIPYTNLILARNRTVLQDTTLLSEIKADPLSSFTINILSKDNVELNLSGLNKQICMDDLFEEESCKRNINYVAIKFKVRNQNNTFTRSYNSALTVREVKENLSLIFQCEADNMEFIRHEVAINNLTVLRKLDYDEYGIIDIELVTKDNTVLSLQKLYKELAIPDVLAVSVPFCQMVKQITVEIIFDPIPKPYLGGYKNIHTGTEYHHAFTQTPQRPEKIPSESKTCRDTQTAEEREKYFDTPYSRATQMANEIAYIPNVTDRIMVPRPYETYEEMVRRLNHAHYASIIQRAFRHHQFRQKVAKWIADCMERIERMKEEERLEREAIERRLRKDLITKTFPRTREDFDQLYAMVDRWKTAEIARISQLHSKGPKIAEFTLLLDKEVELLRCIETYRLKVKEDSRKIKEYLFLEEISKPVAWFARDGKTITMDSIEIQKARKLKDLYALFLREDMKADERMELLVEMKLALKEFCHPLTEDIILLLDRECELMVRNCNDKQLDYLRRRTAASVLQFIKTSELNSRITESQNVRDYRKMEHGSLYFCELCQKLKLYTDFPLNVKMKGYLACTSCSWKDTSERCWIDMTPYKFILRAVQRDERRRKCWSSLAFVLREKDVHFIVEKLWHSHSAISECRDMIELRLCRWRVHEDWSPWNCFLVTVQEMKAHLKLEDPESVYDEELVKKVLNKLALARANFEQLLAVNKRLTESGEWGVTRAPATLHARGVDPL